MLGISWRDHAINEEVTRKAGTEDSNTLSSYKEKENGWPHHQTAETNTGPYSNVLGARRRHKKEREAEEHMAKHLQKRLGRKGC